MAILGRNILDKHGPYIRFYVVDAPFSKEWFDKGSYENGLFMEFADDLLDIYCSLTQSYSPFDPDASFIEFGRSHDIYEFTAKLLMWEAQLAKTPVNYFGKSLDYYYDYFNHLKSKKNPATRLKSDLLETLHFMIAEMHKAAVSGKCVIIYGR